MKIITKVEEVRQFLDNKTGRVGFVPTMGALHQGHISLVNLCRKECDVVVASVFVNPTQFNDPKDLVNYPRTPEKDAEMLRKAGVDMVFMPTPEEIYPEPDTRIFDFGSIEQVMEGVHRPGHFNGVAQVVSRLFDIVKPERAYFGEKDFQQLAIIRNLVEKTNTPVQIIGCPIIRNDNGLALSSRNALLTPNQMEAAPTIYRVLKQAAEMAKTHTVQETIEYVTNQINHNIELKVEYFTLVDPISLQPINNWSDAPHAHGCIAVQVGNVRLIDNMKFA